MPVGVNSPAARDGPPYPPIGRIVLHRFRCEKSAYLGRVRRREPVGPAITGQRYAAQSDSESQETVWREPSLGGKGTYRPLPTPYSGSLIISPSWLLTPVSSICTSAIPVYCFIPCICL